MTNLIKALLVLIVAGGMAIWLLYNSNSKKEEFNFVKISDINQITKFVLQTSDSKIVLEKHNNIWTVNQTNQARDEAIMSLLAITDKLQVIAPAAQKLQDSLQTLILSTGIEVRLFSSQTQIAHYYISLLPADATTCYALNPNNNKIYMVHTPGFPNSPSHYFFSKEVLWLDKILFYASPNTITNIRLHYTQKPEQSFCLKIDNGNFVVTDLNNKKINGNIDTNAIQRYLTYFSNLQFESIAPLADSVVAKITTTQQPLHQLQIETTNNQITTITTFLKNDDTLPQKIDVYRLYGQLNNSKHLFILTYTNLDLVLKKRGYFVQNTL